MTIAPVLEASMHRLEAALTRIESAASRHLHLTVEDRRRLEQELAAAREEYGELSRVTDTVSNRLDAAIDRLKLAIGE